jgi:hypothetical protein
MATRKASTSGVLANMDDELRSARHDDILNWLVDSLDLVVDRLFTRSPEWMEKIAGEKRAESRRHVEDVCRRLESISQSASDEVPRTGVPIRLILDPATRDAARDKAAELSRWLECPDWDRCKNELGRAKLLNWEMLKPVAQVQPGKAPGRPPRRTESGFVDLCVSVQRTVALELSGLPEFRRSSLVGAARDVDVLSNVAIGQLAWTAVHATFDLWVTVRSGSFTLGEVLYELKALRQLEDGQHRVALCVDSLPVDTAGKLRHERLYVIEKSAFDADLKPFIVGLSDPRPQSSDAGAEPTNPEERKS